VCLLSSPPLACFLEKCFGSSGYITSLSPPTEEAFANNKQPANARNVSVGKQTTKNILILLPAISTAQHKQ
jgi:hypothetical protein